VRAARADASMTLLDNSLVPYGVLPGNHDMVTTTRDAPLYNATFPYTRYETEPWYGGHYDDEFEERDNNNSFQLISAAGVDLIILHLEYNPRPEVITWADGILRANSDRKAIITTHAYLNSGGDRRAEGNSIWTNLVLPNDNVHFVLCGHISAETVTTALLDDREVHQILADYQSRTNGGNGWLRIMRFEPAENTVYVETYSPYLAQYETDPDSEFTLDFPMVEFTVIDAVTGVASGSNASVVWPGLREETEYVWCAQVTDSTARTTTGPVWSFTTAGTPPVISNVASSNITDSSATIAWKTDELSNSLVNYGTDKPPLTGQWDAAMVTSPSVTLTGLLAGTTYYYEVKSTDAAGNSATDNSGGAYYEFTTQPPDTEPPQIISATGNIPSGTTGEDETISATITDNMAVASATVHYTPIDGTETTVAMTEGPPNVWSADVPVASDKVGMITYYITAEDAASNPGRDPAEPGTYAITVTDNDAPSAISDLTATAVADGHIDLAWSAATECHHT